MHSTPDPKQTGPYDVRADVEFAKACTQLARTPEQLAHVQEQFTQQERDAERYPSDPQIRVNTFRPAVARDRPALRGLIGLLLAACIFVAAFVSQSSYGDALKSTMARWAPQLVPTSSQLLEKPGLPAQRSPPSVQAAAAEQAPPQPVPLAETASQDVAPTAAQVAPRAGTVAPDDNARSRKRGAREQLKTSQAQIVRDNAKFAEQVKASQEQVARFRQDPRPKTPLPPARPIATPTREPARTLPSSQATARPQAPPQLQAEKP